jgi:hypothetical protein
MYKRPFFEQLIQKLKGQRTKILANLVGKTAPGLIAVLLKLYMFAQAALKSVKYGSVKSQMKVNW